ncbi:MAG: GAF domain-containing protein [Polyangiaceae bacterium]
METHRTNAALARAIAAVAEASASGALDTALRAIMEEVVGALDVERSSAWLYNPDASAIRCVELFVRSAGSHESGVELRASDYPRYFAALRAVRTIAADDAHTDPTTSEFSSGYLTPLGIGAMLDCPIRVGDRMIGVLCNEHVGAARRWTDAEAAFAASVADLLAIAIEGRRRRDAEEELRAALALADEG